MSTARRRSTTPGSPTLSNRKQRKLEERARRRAAERAQLLRRAGIPALVVVLVVVGLVVYLTRPQPDSALRLDTAHGSSAGLAWSPDGKQVALGGTAQDSNVRIVDAGNGQVVHTLAESKGDTNDLAWSASGAYLAVAEQPQAPAQTGKTHATPPAPALLQLWQTAGWSRRTFPGTALAGPPALALSFSPDGSRLAVQNQDGVEVLAVPSMTRLSLLANPFRMPDIHPILAWSPDGRSIAIGQGSLGAGEVAILDARSLHLKRAITLSGTFPTNLVGTAAWSPDGVSLAVGSLGGRIVLYSATTGRKLRDLDAGLNSLATMAWAPDGVRLAVGGNNELAVYDTRSGHVLQRRSAPVDAEGASTSLNRVLRLAWSPNGRQLAISSSNGYGRIWTPATP